MKTMLVLLFLVLVFAFTGKNDYEEAKTDERWYCKMVATGIWPDYEGRYLSQPEVKDCDSLSHK